MMRMTVALLASLAITADRGWWPGQRRSRPVHVEPLPTGPLTLDELELVLAPERRQEAAAA